ncbi:hypothetical protein DJ030_06170 [bacterium endosymbiont of Escarpia laminata]|nr:MAG: hypothetical protein DJ031_16915 [bacterium endosymbiont of Escarpia laminata]RLJ20726.1 MAG: hypothetical protein DJ030_06170 [bacterium endosymbiont of Escarpia laminata]
MFNENIVYPTAVGTSTLQPAIFRYPEKTLWDGWKVRETAGAGHSHFSLENHSLYNLSDVYWNLPTPALVEQVTDEILAAVPVVK